MIDIILATYNGERFLQQQLLSIQQNNEYQELISRIIVVDDGSTDNTQSIIQTAIKSDSKIEWHHNCSGQSGAMANFAFGLSLSTSAYIMLCDQDDIWLPEKIALSFQTAQTVEAKHNINTPILVFSDKQIVDERLNVLCESYFSLKQISKQWHHSFESLSQQNVASGCTMLMNRALLEKSLPIPERAYMHDWWLALVASRCGVIELIDKPLIQYRQHDNNTIGVKQRKPWQLFTQFPLQFSKFKHSFECIRQQAQVFELFEKQNNLMPNETIAALAAISKMSRVERLTAYRQGLITRSNPAGKIALLITLLMLPRK